MKTLPKGLSTRCIHAGDALDAKGALTTPLYNHSTFGFADTASLLEVVEGRREGSLYTRYGQNPTIVSVEAKLASVEGGEGALVFSSGMAAEAATLLSFCKAGDHIVCVGDVYGGSFELLSRTLPALGITTTFLLDRDLENLERAFTPTTKIVFFETPTNPRMDVLDIQAIAETAHRHGALVAVDNTFATPVNQNPLALGADLVLHSATKYLGGHSDLTGGVVIGASGLLASIRPLRRSLGQMMAPEVAHLLARSLRTLVVRVKAHNENASTIARRLEEHARVEQVSYPGLPSHPEHALARRQMRGFGGMLSFVVRGAAREAASVVDALRLFSIAPSLGGVESLATQPVTTTHHGLTEEEREERGIVGGMIRLSVGLEDVEDLWADLEQALEAR